MESSEPSSPVALPMPTFQERRATTHAPPPPTPEAEHTETIRFAPELTENIQTCARVRPAEGVHAVTVADGNRIEQMMFTDVTFTDALRSIAPNVADWDAVSARERRVNPRYADYDTSGR